MENKEMTFKRHEKEHNVFRKRIINLELSLNFWKKAHLSLQRQFTRYIEKHNKKI